MVTKLLVTWEYWGGVGEIPYLVKLKTIIVKDKVTFPHCQRKHTAEICFLLPWRLALLLQGHGVTVSMRWDEVGEQAFAMVLKTSNSKCGLGQNIMLLIYYNSHSRRDVVILGIKIKGIFLCFTSYSIIWWLLIEIKTLPTKPPQTLIVV